MSLLLQYILDTLKSALEKGNRGMVREIRVLGFECVWIWSLISSRSSNLKIPSFFQTLESPAVAEYKAQQELALKAAVSAGEHKRLLEVQHSEYISPGLDYDDEDEEEDNDDEAADTLAPMHVAMKDRRSRVSALYGVATEPKKKKKGLLNKIGKSMKKLST